MVAAAGLVALTVAACGGETGSTTVTVTTAATSPTPVTTTRAASKRAQRRSHRRSKPTRASTTFAGRTACDANIRVKAATTSCAFGQNVFYGFWKAQHQGDDSFEAYSPLTKESYALACSSGATVICRAGDGGEVRFPMAAVGAYTASEAKRFAATHDLGPRISAASVDDGAPSSSSGESDTSSGDGSSSDCDASYTGACLDSNASDYDCEGGSGDGPEYTGRVTVVGDDHFDLDRDGDGVGCD
jgi:hypothetical protein